MHKADQIIAAAERAIIDVVDTSVVVKKHRRTSIVLEGGTKFVSVDFGEDVPVTEGFRDLDGTIESLLTVNATAVVLAKTEDEVRQVLLELRADIHRALSDPERLQLNFVLDTHYGGAVPPEVDVEGTPIAGELVNQWGVRYEMPRDNPE